MRVMLRLLPRVLDTSVPPRFANASYPAAPFPRGRGLKNGTRPHPPAPSPSGRGRARARQVPYKAVSPNAPFPAGRGQGGGRSPQPRRYGHRPAPRAFLLAVAALVAVLSVACDRGTPPPSNPLDESRTTGTAAPVPTGPAIFPPSPNATSTAAPGASPTPTPPLDPATEAAREKAAGRAIDAMAGWLGVSQIEFTIDKVEVVAWPNACLGVSRPGVACAQVVTPGERVTLRHRSGEWYEVHLGPREAAAWRATRMNKG